MVKLKVGRNIVSIDENDLILDNGSCYQIVTQQIVRGWDKYPPVMSKKLFADLKKCEFIFTNENLKQAALKKYGSHGLTFWKFNIDKMKQYGYDK